jgi:hypothetical protein
VGLGINKVSIMLNSKILMSVGRKYYVRAIMGVWMGEE